MNQIHALHRILPQAFIFSVAGSMAMLRPLTIAQDTQPAAVSNTTRSGPEAAAVFLSTHTNDD
jgi:hypothetical protein